MTIAKAVAVVAKSKGAPEDPEALEVLNKSSSSLVMLVKQALRSTQSWSKAEGLKKMEPTLVVIREGIQKGMSVTELHNAIKKIPDLLDLLPEGAKF